MASNLSLLSNGSHCREKANSSVFLPSSLPESRPVTQPPIFCQCGSHELELLGLMNQQQCLIPLSFQRSEVDSRSCSLWPFESCILYFLSFVCCLFNDSLSRAQTQSSRGSLCSQRGFEHLHFVTESSGSS